MPRTLTSKIASRLGKSISSSTITSSGEVSGGSSLNTYAGPNNFPTSGNSVGDQGWDTSNNRLYIWNGSGWYSIAVGDPV